MLTSSPRYSDMPLLDIERSASLHAQRAADRERTHGKYLACLAALLSVIAALSPVIPHAPPAVVPAMKNPVLPAAAAAMPADRPPPDDWIHLDVQPGDSLSTLFDRAGLPPSEWLDVQALGEDAEPLLQPQTGEVIDVQRSADGHLQQLRMSLDSISTLVVARHGDQLRTEIDRRRTQVQQRTLDGRIAHSLSQAVHAAGGTPVLSVQLARIFGSKLDLRHLVHGGDHFTAIYESQVLDGKPVETGAVLAARLQLGDKSYEAFRYTDASGRTAYYDNGGHPYERSILRAPLRYTRISSDFSLRRFNPVLHLWRAHYGVDYAAPTGTPIEAAADGRIAFIGHARGYGRLIELQHFDDYSTRYAHLSAFAGGLHQGASVVQGQIIGYVGASGEATGPHLHFEIRRHGTPRNPRTVALPGGHAIPPAQLARYTASIHTLLARLDLPASPSGMMLASTDGMPSGNQNTGACPAPAHGKRTSVCPRPRTAEAAGGIRARAQRAALRLPRLDARADRTPGLTAGFDVN